MDKRGLVFRWDDGHAEAEGIYLDDHSYRSGDPC